MKAVGYKETGPIDRADALIDFETDKPSPIGHDLLVKVQAISVNPVDTKIRQRRPPEGNDPAVLGWDAVGTVEAIGDAVTSFKTGDIVWYAGAINRSGTNAEFHLVDERIAGLAPKSIPATAAAALPLTTLTAYEMLFDRLCVGKAVPSGANTLLVIGGAGGVGSITIQLARALTDLTVIATASRPETQDWVRDLGAHHVINHAEPLGPQLDALGIKSVDFVYSTNHSNLYVAQAGEMMTPQGRFGLIDDPTEFDIMPFKPKSISVHWEFMYTRSLFGTGDMARQGDILNEVAELIDAGNIKSTATQTLGTINAANLSKAHAILESGKAKGKLVLNGFPIGQPAD
ncbi:zinc-binding alcohol dehydrogenase family protein [Pelagimonas varians]|uniref:Zinc-type alcohol dehydrogenase-like protein n=1 Tax=Pelagimonas varians TaxID=696760 RepID=A0A238KTB3_9RHOB|nr:zinc-binding alcohol dehydrogenase family protein [Pelagimonas varians]PYG32566.1 zinc-binding alcohol dehydrogenase family protein [Pelagimonas varians]SMX45968.1 Zinc-type alcohol dehydrogenase-like protein [Pelagimonas varians]